MSTITPEAAVSGVTATKAAELLRVSLHTVVGWTARGHLVPIGRNEQGRRVYDLDDLIAAEKATRARARRT